MWCPQGHGEFQSHVQKCVDCDAALVSAEALEEPLVEASGRTQVEVIKAVRGTADVDALELSLRAANIEFFWSGGDLAVSHDRVDDAAELVGLAANEVAPIASPASAYRRTRLASPRLRSLLVWLPALLALNFGVLAYIAKADSFDGGASLWKVASTQAAVAAMLGAGTLAWNWGNPRHRRAAWLLGGAAVLVAAALLR